MDIYDFLQQKKRSIAEQQFKHTTTGNIKQVSQKKGNMLGKYNLNSKIELLIKETFLHFEATNFDCEKQLQYPFLKATS